MLKATKGLTVYADTFGIPPEMSHPFVRLFLSYIRNCGEEYAVKLFKEIKLSFIKRKAHPDVSYFVPWLKHGNTYHAGPIGALEKWCRINHKRWSKVIKLLGIYTSIYSSELLPSQERKFLDGVTSRNIALPDNVCECIKSGTTLVKARYLNDDQLTIRLPKRLWEYSVSPTRRAPLPDGTSVPEDQAVWKTLAYTRFTSLGMDIRGRFPAIFSALEHGINVDFPDDTPDLVLYKNSVGKIGFIQEPGMKLRAVANPGRIYQSALRPLGDVLFGVLKKLPWDCTFDQGKAIPFIQSHLQQQGVCHSVDLTGATDYFPLDLQKQVLDILLNDEYGYSSLFYTLSKSPWLYKNGQVIRWTKGQPLGLYPSFPAFAITHGILLYALNGFQHNNQFFVLGDDVLILDDNLYKSYISVMTSLECPISQSKSISSSYLAEFAGKIITAEDVVLQLKWRPCSDDSFLDVVRNLGPSSLTLMRSRQRAVCKKLWEVPDFMGGLGFNPKGKTLSMRIYESLILLGDPSVRSYLLSLNQFVTANNYSSNIGNISFVLEIFDPDKGFKDIIHRMLPILLKWYDISGGNLWLMNPDMHLRFTSRNDRESLLEQLERSLP